MIVSVISFESIYSKKIKGGGAEISRRVKLLEEDGAVVFVHSFSASSAKGNVGKETLYRRSRLGFILAPWLPIPVSTRSSSKLLSELRKNQPDVIIVEGFQSSRHIKEIKKLKVKTILRVHNIESDYHIQMTKSLRGLRRFYHWLVGMQYKLFEKRVLKYFDLVLHISKEEYVKSLRWMNGKSRYVPPIAKPISRNSYDFGESGGKNIVIFGDFSIGGNLIGADWFVNKVFPILSKKYPEIALHIVGIDSHKLSRDSNKIVAYGYIDDINEFFNKKKPLVVVPIAFGGGVKIKTIDTMVSGIPAIYSFKSLEGIGKEIEEQAMSFRELSTSDALDLFDQLMSQKSEIDAKSRYLKDAVLESFDGKIFLNVIKNEVFL